MPTKKDRKKTQASQKKQKAAKDNWLLEKERMFKEVKLLQERLDEARNTRTELGINLQVCRRDVAALQREKIDLERKLGHQEKLTADMLSTHQGMRQSLKKIREMHHFEEGKCIECGSEWPCATYQHIALPEQVAVTNLLLWERELEQETEATRTESKGVGEGDAHEESNGG